MKQLVPFLLFAACMFVTCSAVPAPGDAPASDSKAKNLIPTATPVDGFSEEAFDSPHEAYRRDHEIRPYYLWSYMTINSGGMSYTDETNTLWHTDNRFVTGGRQYSTTDPIANTQWDPIYQTERNGDFSYEIPAPEGLYTVELHFAEFHWNNEGLRVFDVTIENGQFKLEDIDIFKDYGGKNYASKITAEHIHVVDGHLSIDFITKIDRAKISGIRIFQEVLPNYFRINTGSNAQSSSGSTSYNPDRILSDQHFHGGKVYSVPPNSQLSNQLYLTERFGNFAYRLPVPKDGLYTVELHFAEIAFVNEGARVFDIDIEHGQKTINDIDLFKEFGRRFVPIVKIITDIEVTDGVLDIEFSASVNYGKISGIVVISQDFPPNAPLFETFEDVALDVGQEWTFQPVATFRGTNPSPWGSNFNLIRYTAVGLPPGLSIAQGRISGTPTKEGSYKVLIRATDIISNQFSITTFTINVSTRHEVIRINSGGGSLQFGEEYWQRDQYFTDGRTYSNELLITNTQNDLLYQSERNGDFSYEIPVPEEGHYTVELHFAEIFWDRAGAPVREFDVSVENQQFTQRIQTYGQVNRLLGYRFAHVLKATDIKVTDGFLTVDLTTIRDRAKISGIAVIKQGHAYSGETLRINSGGDAFFYGAEEWSDDSYFTGGQIHRNDYFLQRTNFENTFNHRLYHTERYGNFSYSLPAQEEGAYTVELHFAEIWWDEEGKRIFDVEVENEQFKLENIDLYKDHGGKFTASVFIAENIEVTDGMLDIEFKSKVNNAKVSGVVIRKQDDLKPDMNASARLLAEPESTEEPALNVRFGEAKLYPNPTSDRVRLDFDTDQHASWSFVLVSPNGQTLFLDKIDLETGSHSVDFDLSVHRLSSGIYFLQVSDGKGNVNVMRLIKH